MDFLLWSMILALTVTALDEALKFIYVVFGINLDDVKDWSPKLSDF